jgi:hypothetical protein
LFDSRFLFRRAVLCALVGFLVVISAKAQIVNVESKRPGSTDEGWHGNINLNLDYTQNTSKLLRYGMKNQVQYLKAQHRLLVLTDLQRVRADGTNFLNNGYEHVRYNLDIGEKGSFSLEGFQQAQFNSVQKIDFRHLTGAGVRLNVFDRDSLKFWMGTLPMFEYEVLTDKTLSKDFRQSTYLLFFIQLKNGVEFQTIGYYQPRMDWLGDYRLSNSTSIEFGLLKWLRFKVSVDLLYDSNAPEGVPNLIFTLKNGLMAEF